MGLCISKSQIVKSTQNPAQTTAQKPTKSQPNIHKYYEFTQLLGEGNYGFVKEAVRVCEPEKGIKNLDKNRLCKFAVKSISKLRSTKDHKNAEVEVLRKLDHPYLISLVENFEDKNYFYLVTEHCKGQTLAQRLRSRVLLTENEVCTLLYQMLTAVSYLHNQNIVHRDLKPDNFVFDEDDLKLLDFGMSRMTKQKITRRAGTPYYMAPEVISKNYSFECDVWALGVIAYYLVSGKHPFSGKSMDDLFRSIETKKPLFNGKGWNLASNHLKDLVSKMLIKDPLKRISAQEALNHPCLRGLGSCGKANRHLLEKLCNYKPEDALSDKAKRVLVKALPNRKLGEFKNAFLHLDREKKGYLTRRDIKSVVPDLEIPSDFPLKIFYSDFICATLDLKYDLSDEDLKVAFRYFDMDNDGTLSKEDIYLRLQKDSLDSEYPKLQAPRAEFGLKPCLSFDQFKKSFCTD